MENASLLAELKTNYHWLFSELGFDVVKDEFLEASFGNSYVVLRGPRGWLRLVRDRGLRSIERSDNGTEDSWIFMGGDALVLPNDPPNAIPGFDEVLANLRI